MPSSSSKTETSNVSNWKKKQSRLSFLPIQSVTPTLVKSDGTPVLLKGDQGKDSKLHQSKSSEKLPTKSSNLEMVKSAQKKILTPQSKSSEKLPTKASNHEMVKSVQKKILTPHSKSKSDTKLQSKSQTSNSTLKAKSSLPKNATIKDIKLDKKKSLNVNKIKKQTINISDDDDKDEDMPLSVLKNKISTVKKTNITPTKVVFPDKLNPQDMRTVKVSPVKSIPLTQMKLTSTSIQKFLPNLKNNLNTFNEKIVTNNTSIAANRPIPTNGSVSTQVNKTNPPAKTGSSNVSPIYLVPANSIKPKQNVVIALDMELQKWKSLTTMEQQKIINEKRSQVGVGPKFITVAIKSPISSQPIKPAPVINSIITSNQYKNAATLIPPKMPCNTNFITTKTYQTVGTAVIRTENRPHMPFQLMERRMENELVDLKPLPKLKRVKVPHQIMGKGYGELLMITEFLNIYRKFLGVEEEFKILTETLVHDIAYQKESESVLKVLLYFLKVLLGNESYKIRGLKMELADLPLTEYTVSFLVEQFLKSLDKKKKQKRAEEIALAAAKILEEDANEDKETVDLEEWEHEETLFDDDDYEEEERKRKNKKKSKKPTKKASTFEEEEVARELKYQTISKFLEKNEFHQLTPFYQIEIMTLLMTNILESEEFQSYHDDLMTEKVEATRALETYRRNKREEKMAEFKKNNPKIDDFVQKIPNPSQLNANVQAATGGKGLDDIDESDAKKDVPGKDVNTTEVKTPPVADSKETNAEIKKEAKSIIEKNELEQKKEDPYSGMTQRQIQAIKMEAKQVEEKKLEDLRLSMEKERNEIRELTKKIDEANDLYKRSQRLETLGYDRYNRTYWLFSNVNPGLYVNSFHEWYVVDNVKAVDDLINSLSMNGVREDRLRLSLKTNHKKIVESINLWISLQKTEESPTKSTEINDSVKPGKIEKPEDKYEKKDEVTPSSNGIEINGGVTSETSNSEGKKGDTTASKESKEKETLKGESDIDKKKNAKKMKNDDGEDKFASSIEALKCDLYESSARIVQGNLGVISNYDQWTASLTEVSVLSGIKSFVSSIQKSIFEKSLLTPFKGFDPAFTGEWTKAVENAETLSKLHTLYGILENSISWERSSESLRCSVCRRKQGVRNSTPMVVCDGCQNSYHLNCIRPPLSEIPQCVWLCPKCTPKNVIRSQIYSPYTEQNQSYASNPSQLEEDEQSDHEDLCHVCKADGMMILCDTCPLSFHFECHDPPLRRAPKGAWSCFECRKGNLKKIMKKKGKVETSEKDELSVDTDEEAFEKEKPLKKTKTKPDRNASKNDNEKSKKSNSDNSRKLSGRKRKQVYYKESLSEEESENDRNRKSNDKTNNKTNSKRKRNSNESDWEASVSMESNSLSLSIKRPRYAKDSLNDSKKTVGSGSVRKSNDKIESNSKLDSITKESKVTKETKRPVKKSRMSRRDTNCELKACRKILTQLRKDPDAESFRDPVNRREVPGYYNIIDRPIYLNKIMEKLDSIQYDDVLGFVRDVKLIFSNCRKYHKDPASVIRCNADRLETTFKNLLSQHLPGMTF